MTTPRRRPPSGNADPAFVEALAEIARGIAASLSSVDRRRLPVRMILAGGAAMHYYTGSRTTEDVDAVFSARVLLPDDLDAYYVDASGSHRLLYFDRQYNDTLGLVHEDARDDSIPIVLPGVDPGVLEVRALAPVDIAVSKIGRFEEHDREDIVTLARRALISERAVRRRAEEALSYYVGNPDRTRTSLQLAIDLIRANRPRSRAAGRPARTGRSSGRRSG
jgi:hypothetical protein